jgi:hypothetical protein
MPSDEEIMALLEALGVPALDPAEEIAVWANEVDQIPGCLGELLKAIHAAMVSIQVSGTSGPDGWTPAEYTRWGPVMFAARHYTQDVVRAIADVKDIPAESALAQMEEMQRVLRDGLPVGLGDPPSLDDVGGCSYCGRSVEGHKGLSPKAGGTALREWHRFDWGTRGAYSDESPLGTRGNG